MLKHDRQPPMLKSERELAVDQRNHSTYLWSDFISFIIIIVIINIIIIITLISRSKLMAAQMEDRARVGSTQLSLKSASDL